MCKYVNILRYPVALFKIKRNFVVDFMYFYSNNLHSKNTLAIIVQKQ